MAVKEIEMIELEVEESKKTKMSLEQELTKMRQHYEETVLRANERNRSLQSELENMKNKVQESSAAEEMEKAQMEALKQVQIERTNFASEKEEMLQEKEEMLQEKEMRQEKGDASRSLKPTRENTRGKFPTCTKAYKRSNRRRKTSATRYDARRGSSRRVHEENCDFANRVGF